jgi:hypothetical protein
MGSRYVNGQTRPYFRENSLLCEITTTYEIVKKSPTFDKLDFFLFHISSWFGDYCCLYISSLTEIPAIFSVFGKNSFFIFLKTKIRKAAKLYVLKKF